MFRCKMKRTYEYRRACFLMFGSDSISGMPDFAILKDNGNRLRTVSLWSDKSALLACYWPDICLLALIGMLHLLKMLADRKPK